MTIKKATESFQVKYPQAKSMRIRDFVAGSSITGLITGKTQMRQSSRVRDRLKVYAEIRLDNGTLKYVRIGGELAWAENLIGLENLVGIQVTAVVKSYISDDGEEICYTDEASFTSRNIIEAIQAATNTFR